MHGASFMPVCKESKACTSAVDKKAPFMPCKCAGEGVGDIPTLEVVDKVKIPKDLPAGEWVLSWRWVSLLPSFVARALLPVTSLTVCRRRRTARKVRRSGTVAPM